MRQAPVAMLGVADCALMLLHLVEAECALILLHFGEADLALISLQTSKLVPDLQYYYMGFYIHTCPKVSALRAPSGGAVGV